ncbi:hypothetical protein VIGAN_08356800 [Vigna angularis var. angularis]|uniref:Uncharacterized protein n=1 Tax=Vigna angularis var. angularis TaxID=157739 RepID=A0A0S3SUT9_PHAAN|nr:hypothetical protein VIGAN_08356800 [Vigna angularis var. angularis]
MTPIPLVSHVAMLKSSISCSVFCPINAMTPCTAAASLSTKFSAISPSPQLQKTRFKLSKSSWIITLSDLLNTLELPPASKTMRNASKEAFINSLIASA